MRVFAQSAHTDADGHRHTRPHQQASIFTLTQTDTGHKQSTGHTQS